MMKIDMRVGSILVNVNWDGTTSLVEIELIREGNLIGEAEYEIGNGMSSVTLLDWRNHEVTPKEIAEMESQLDEIFSEAAV